MKRLIMPETEADITKAAIWYENREHGLGLELLSDIHQSSRALSPDPKHFSAFAKNLKFVAFWPDDFPIASSLLINRMC